jgi:hypothetical protein
MNALGTIKNNGDQDLYIQKLESAVNILSLPWTDSEKIEIFKKLNSTNNKVELTEVNNYFLKINKK